MPLEVAEKLAGENPSRSESFGGKPTLAPFNDDHQPVKRHSVDAASWPSHLCPRPVRK